MRDEFLRLLREDVEFRYAVLGLLGIEEVLKSISKNTEAIKDLQQQVRDLQHAEEVFREGMRGVVERILGVARVERWCYVDEEGFVYGYPVVIDVDLVVKDGEHILIEVKSSVDRGDALELKRISELYERVTGVKSWRSYSILRFIQHLSVLVSFCCSSLLSSS